MLKSVLRYVGVAVLCLIMITGISYTMNILTASTPVSRADTRNIDVEYANTVKTSSRNVRLTEQEKSCLAENIYFEARGEGAEGMIAVAYVTLNRSLHPHFPDNVCDVVYQRNQTTCQFSWVCNANAIKSSIAELKVFEKVEKIVNMVTLNYHKKNDPTGGALFFHNTEADPQWRTHYQQTRQIGNHIFYKPN